MMFTIGALLLILSKAIHFYMQEEYAYKVRPKLLMWAMITYSIVGCAMMTASLLIMSWRVLP